VSEDQRATRREYDRGELRRRDLDINPFKQFGRWLQAATEAELVDATAMTLATVDLGGQPNARTLLLKHFDEEGFVFYTDYDSQKGLEIAENPRCALLFYWREFDRQIRIQGSLRKVAEQISDDYFASRPLESQVSAAASQQSRRVENRAALEAQAQALRDQSVIRRPERWGGYVLVPHAFEFWQGRVGRLHDRFRYELADGEWSIDRLQP
jgi:pyridoxamine 5'-phosphate oxidase